MLMMFEPTASVLLIQNISFPHFSTATTENDIERGVDINILHLKFND